MKRRFIVTGFFIFCSSAAQSDKAVSPLDEFLFMPGGKVSQYTESSQRFAKYGSEFFEDVRTYCEEAEGVTEREADDCRRVSAVFGGDAIGDIISAPTHQLQEVFEKCYVLSPGDFETVDICVKDAAKGERPDLKFNLRPTVALEKTSRNK